MPAFLTCVPVVWILWTSTVLAQDCVDPGSCVTAVNCTDSSYSWANNIKKQDACLMYGYASKGYENRTISIRALEPTSSYTASTDWANNSIHAWTCTTLTYSLASVCSACQGSNYVSWSDWSTNCTSDDVTIPYCLSATLVQELGYDFPDWAYQDVVTNGNFDLNIAHKNATARPSVNGARPALTSTAALAGAIAGSLLGFCLLVGLIAFRVRIGRAINPPIPTPGPPMAERNIKPLSRKLQAYEYCGLCRDTHRRDDVVLVDGCNHRFCPDMLHQYVDGQLQERRFPVLCPSCTADIARKNSEISESLIKQIGVSHNNILLYKELEMDRYSVEVYCRRCQGSARVDREDLIKADFILTCPIRGCSYVWCNACNEEAARAEEHICPDTEAFNQLAAENRWKKCPGCQIMVEKTEGCDHMTCRKPGCNTGFCYYCGQVWSTGHICP